MVGPNLNWFTVGTSVIITECQPLVLEACVGVNQSVTVSHRWGQGTTEERLLIGFIIFIQSFSKEGKINVSYTGVFCAKEEY